MKNFIKKHKQQTIVAASILILLVVTVGTSFAFFNYAKKGTTENSIKLGEITFKYTENGTNGNGITITDAFPISDEEGKTKTDKGNYFDFKVEANSTRSNIEYEVVAEPTKNNTLPLDAIKFYLTELNNSEETVIDSCLNADGTVKTLDKFTNTTITGQTGKTIYQETILTNTKGYLKQFRARMWIRDGLDISDEKYENKSGQIRVNVYANADRSTAATDTTTPEDTRVERVTANNKYLFTAVTNEKYQYELVVPNEIDNVDISVITTNMSAKTSITPTELLTRSQIYSLAVGENFFKATVTSDDGTKKQDYVLKVTREKSSNTGLNSLTVGNYELKPSYSDNNDIYEVQVPNEITSVDVNAVAKESTQTIKGTGTYNLNVGSNEVIVNVTSENGTVRTIRINVIRKLPNDASINNVGVNNYTLNHLEGNIYTVEVPYGVGEIEIANISTTGANVTEIGKKQLNVGNNDFEVTVTSASGETTIKYIIRVIRQKDTNNDLKNLNLSNCTISPQFDKDTLEYTCEVENNVAETIITAEPLSNAAKVVGIGKKTLAYGVNTFKVTVTAQNGDAKTYTITVTRKASSDTNLKSLTVSNGTLTPEFDGSKTEYTVSVPYNVSTVTVAGAANSSEATVTGTGSKSLTVGANTITVTVTAEDKTEKTYTITITREKDTDNTLKSLNLTSCTLTPTFASGTTAYACTVANSVTETTVTAIATSSVATVSGTGKKTLSAGSNTINVTVTSQSGTTKIYTIMVTRLSNSDASLKSLTVSSGTLTPEFVSSKTEYTVSVPYSVDNIKITGEATVSTSNVTGLGSKVLEIGENTFPVVVTAEDKTTTRTYTITVTRQKDTDTSLKSIGVTGYNIVKVDNNNYTLTVENNVTSAEITATATSSVATVSGTGKKTLSVGANTFKVIVTAQNGSISAYNVVITRKASSDATLKSLTLSTGTLSPAFSSTTASYAVSVPYSISAITIAASANNSEATVTGAGTKQLAVGANTITITVTAGDKTTKTYKVTVTRQKDTDNNLKSLGLTSCTLSPTFTSDTTSYTCTVANNVTETTVTAESTSGVATIAGTGKKTLNVGNNAINVVVTSQSGATKTYTVTVHRKSNDATLSSLSVTGYTLTPTFTSSTTNYALTVPSSVSNITVNATKNHSAASVSGTGTKTLAAGLNAIKIKVTAEDGNTKEYVINVKRMTVDTVSLTAVNTTYTGSAIAANTATAKSGTAITYTYYSTTNCTGTALSGAPTNVGNYSAKATSAGNTNYNSGSACATHTISRGTPTISLAAKSVEATGSPISANAATAKNPNGTAVTLSYTYVYYSTANCTGTALSGAPSAAGSYSVKATSTATTNLNSASACATHTISKNTNNNLNSLSLTGYSISPTFAAATTSYTATTEATSVVVKATAATSLATVSGTGTKSLSWGSNTLAVIVTSQSGSAKTYKITVTNQRPTAPTLTGGSSEWVSTAPTIKVVTAGSAISGVDHYEYYKSTSSTSPSDATTATGTTSGNVTISDEGTTYIWYRTVSKNGNKSAWTSSPQVTNLRTSGAFAQKILDDNYNIINTSPTLTNSSNNTSDTNGLYSSNDTNDGKTTYYFRGNVDNNYVSFAGFTWRIIRINEDGSIRMILQTGINSNKTYAYGTSDKNYYTESNAKTIVDDWYNTNLTGYEQYIVTNNYCEEYRVLWNENYTSDNATAVKFNLYTPTFKCATDGNGHGVVNEKVGLITYDEALYAGAYPVKKNNSYYLYNGSTTRTMSPSGRLNNSIKSASTWELTSSSYSLSYSNNTGEKALRPVINLNGNLEVVGKGTSGSPYSLKRTTLKETIMADNPVITTAPTLTTSSNNTSDASGLYKSTDTNSGNPTYYFRGDVTNNYVEFANLTWRIVRVNEDGTIRIVMQDGINNNANYKYSSAYNNKSYMYYSGNNVESSVNQWLEQGDLQNIMIEEDNLKYIATGNYFCDQAKVSYNGGSYITSSGADMLIYSSYTPNFKCSTDGNGHGVINSSVGLLTYDEVIFAGGYPGKANATYYLANSSITWWTMSPNGYNGSNSSAWRITTNGSVSGNRTDYAHSLRPVVNINADTLVAGFGKKDDPYRIGSNYVDQENTSTID